MSLADFIKHLFYYLLIKVTRLYTDIIIVIIIIIVNIIVCTFISFLSLLLEVNKVILSYLILSYLKTYFYRVALSGKFVLTQGPVLCTVVKNAL